MVGYWVPNSYMTLPLGPLQGVLNQAVCYIFPAYHLHAVENLHSKMDYKLMEVMIHVLGSNDPDPMPKTYTRDSGGRQPPDQYPHQSQNSEPR